MGNLTIWKKFNPSASGFFLGLFLSCVALYWFPLRGTPLSANLWLNGRIIYGSIFVLFSLALLSFAKALPFLRTIDLKQVLIAGAMALLLCFLVIKKIPADYRILSDEATLTATSERMYEAQVSTSYYQNIMSLDSRFTQQNIDKRPPLFPFLLHIFHWALGYSAYWSLTLNAL